MLLITHTVPTHTDTQTYTHSPAWRLQACPSSRLTVVALSKQLVLNAFVSKVTQRNDAMAWQNMLFYEKIVSKYCSATGNVV